MQIARYEGLLQNHAVFKIQKRLEYTQINYQFISSNLPPVVKQIDTETTLGAFFGPVQEVLGSQNTAFIEFHLPCSKEMFPQIERLIPSKVYFDATNFHINIPNRLLDMPMPQAHEVLSQEMERCARLLLDTAPAFSSASPLLEKLEYLIEKRLQDGSINMEVIAEDMNTTPRTLRRWLKKEDIQFTDLLTHIRKAKAEHYLQQQLPPIEVAFLLGYSDFSAFSRAFKNWTGTNIKDYTYKSLS